MDPVAEKLAQLEERIRELEVDARVDDMRASGSTGGLLLLKITGLHVDSPVSGVRMYTGSRYGDGSAESATDTGITIRIPGIAPNITDPSYGDWSDLNFCGGLSLVATWVGASQTHINDIVYETVGLVLLS